MIRFSRLLSASLFVMGTFCFAKVGFKILHINDLDSLLATNSAVKVYDANVESTRTNVGLIHGAQALSSFDKFASNELPSDLNAPLVFYCANTECSASNSAAQRALDFGHTNVSVMVDGVYGWKKAGKPLDPYSKVSEAKEISPRDANALVEQKKAIILDVREGEERHEVIADEKWLPMSKVKTPEFEKWIAGLDKNETIVVHCAAGMRARKVAELLASRGYSTAYFKGPDQWKAAGLPVEKGQAH
jgi:rhodanese-related sulfurtransferase